MRSTIARTHLPLWVWLIPLLLLVTWLGARGLNADSIWIDERMTIFDAGGAPYEPRTLPDIWTGVSSRNPWHAPGYFMILNTWGRLVGWQPPALRALSLLLGVLAVAWTYRLGCDMVSPRVGLYAASVMGVSAFYVYYLHELRMYSLFALLTAITVWVYWRIVTAKREPGILLWPGLLAGGVGMLYTHYFASLPLFAIGLYHLLFVKKTRRWWQVTGVMALAGLLFLPWLSSLFTGLSLAGENLRVRASAAGAPQVVERLAHLFSNGVVAMVGAVVALAAFSWQRGARQVWFLMLAVLGFTLLVNAAIQIIPITRMRYLLGLWPLLALVAGLGIDRLQRWRFAPTLALGVWLALGLWTSLDPSFIIAARVDGSGDQWNIFPWHIATNEFRQYTQPGDALVLSVPDNIGRVPLPEHLIPEFYLSGTGVRITTIGTQTTRRQEERTLESALDFVGESPRVWIAYEPDRPSSLLPQFEQPLSEAYGLCEAVLSGPRYQIELYSRAPVCCMPEGTPPMMRFGGIALVGHAPLPARVTDSLPVTLSWSIADDVPDYTYSAALHVIDASGNLAAQADYGLPISSTACQETVIPLGDLPAGQYQLFVMVYAWASGERLPGEVVATGEQGDRLLLGTFRRS